MLTFKYFLMAVGLVLLVGRDFALGVRHLAGDCSIGGRSRGVRKACRSRGRFAGV